MIETLPWRSASSLCVLKVKEKNTFFFLVSRSVEQHGNKTCAYNFILWQGLQIMSRATTKTQQFRRRHQLPYLLYPHKNKSVFQWTSVPMLRGDSVNIRGGGCWGWLLRFPGCHPHLSRRAGVSFVTLAGHYEQPLGREMWRPSSSDYTLFTSSDIQSEQWKNHNFPRNCVPFILRFYTVLAIAKNKVICSHQLLRLCGYVGQNIRLETCTS